jgi:hypothetical protein
VFPLTDTSVTETGYAGLPAGAGFVTVKALGNAVVGDIASLKVRVIVVPAEFVVTVDKVGAVWSTVDAFVERDLVKVTTSLPATSWIAEFVVPFTEVGAV